MVQSARRSEDEWLAGSPDQREEQGMRLMEQLMELMEEHQRRLREIEQLKEEEQRKLRNMLYNLVLGFMFLFIGLSLL